MRQSFAVGLAMLSFAVSASADLSPAERARRDVVIATVGPRAIHVGDLEDRLATMPSFQRADYGQTDDEVRHHVLERVLVREALLAVAAPADDPLVHYQLARARSGATLRELAKTIPEGARITDAEVAAYYAAHQSDYVSPLRIQVWRLLVATEAEAVAAIDSLKPTGTPEAWGKLCREQSLDEATKLRRGALGYLSPDGTSSETGVRAPPEMYRAALTVSDGEIVPQPIAEGPNFAVVWRRGSAPAKTQTATTAAPEIRRILFDVHFREAKDQLLARLRQAHVKDGDLAALGTLHVDVQSGAVRR